VGGSRRQAASVAIEGLNLDNGHDALADDRCRCQWKLSDGTLQPTPCTSRAVFFPLNQLLNLKISHIGAEV